MSTHVSYEVEGTYLSVGLVGVSRDEEGLLLDFAGHPDRTKAFRVALVLEDAQRMLAELRSVVARLQSVVPADTSSVRH